MTKCIAFHSYKGGTGKSTIGSTLSYSDDFGNPERPAKLDSVNETRLDYPTI